MKKIIFMFAFIYTFVAYANCDEKWEDMVYQQKIYNYLVSGKTYFHSQPTDDSKIRSLFLISGDQFQGYLIFEDFVFGRYIKKDGNVVMGWLKNDNLKITTGTGDEDNNLEKYDYDVYSPFGNLVLDASFEDFYNKWGVCGKSEQQETGEWSNYIYSKDGTAYKYFDNYWKGFSIRSSNINFKEVGSDPDAYRITTITITNKKYMTSRGLSIGMTVNNVINAYGKPFKQSNDKIVYKYKSYTLEFEVKANIITKIIMDESIL